MKISAFTFIKNGEILGYPFIESIQSVLSLVDEFIINVGPSEDNTLQRIQAIQSDKIRVIQSQWNDKMQDRGYVYGQQKMIAQFQCTGDWAFYLEADEVVHEKDLPLIRQTMEQYLHDDDVEALLFDYYHFYGNISTYLDSPGWYKKAPRIIKTSLRSYAPDGLFWLVLDQNKKGRYPKALSIGAHMYHYGWVRTQEQMNLKSQKVQQYWGKQHQRIDYGNIDPTILKRFTHTHPNIIKNSFPITNDLFQTNKEYQPSSKEKRHQWMKKIEHCFNCDLSKKHYTLIK